MGTPLYNTDIIPLTSRPTLSVMDDGDFFVILDTSTGKISKILKTNIMTALKISYDNTTSGLTAETVQAALDELVVNLGSSNSAILALSGRLDALEGTGAGSVANAIDDAVLQKYTGDYTGIISLNNHPTSANNIDYNMSADIGDIGSGKIILSIRTYSAIYVKFEIDSTNIVITDSIHGTPFTHTIAHHLTIVNNIQLHVTQRKGTNFNIFLVSNGERFETKKKLYGTKLAYPELSCENVTLTNISFSWINIDILKPIWCFGDSYFGATSGSRWLYYLEQDGYYNKHMFDSYAGEGSLASFSSLKNMLNKHKPKIIFWTLGMNDGTDNGAINTTWETVKDNLISICNKFGISLVFGTIPTVPTINHEYKNNWIRNSGYQYVDFAKAVGATDSGEWYSGMLSGDGVHPTVQGAKALYYRALADFPQLQLNI